MSTREEGWYWVVMEDSEKWVCMFYHHRYGWDPYSLETDQWG